MPNICWWAIAKPAPSVSSCMGLTVRLEPTAQYAPRMMDMMTSIGTVLMPFCQRPGRANSISQYAVEACCTCTWPVVNSERHLVILLKRTSRMFTMNAISSRIMTCEKPAPKVSSTPAVTAFWPK